MSSQGSTARAQAVQREVAAEPHPFTVPELRLYAYAKKFGETVPLALAEHLARCTDCEFWLKVLHRTDPVLNGEDEVHVKQLIRQAENTASEIAPPSSLADKATVGASAGKAMRVFQQLFGRGPKRGVENERLRVAEDKAGQDAA